MKNYFSLVALAVAVAVTSCSTEDSASGTAQYSSETTNVTLTATMDTPTTRAGMIRDDGYASLYWHADDAISVLTQSTAMTKNEKFTTTAETRATTAEFSGKIDKNAQMVCAAYPYSDKHSLKSDGTTLTYNLPSEYTYTTVESKIFSTETEDRINHINMPMLGTISENNNVAFTHLGGVMVIRVDKMPITAGTLTVTSDQQLSGDFTYTLPTTSDAAITTTTASNGNGKVTFTFKGAAEGNVGVFYLPLATGNYENFQVTLSSGDDYNQTVDYGTQSVSRATITAVSLVAQVKINGHWFVDLGLPSGVLWATTNIGATLPCDYGNYYAWGETETKDSYTWKNNKYFNLADNIGYTKYSSSDDMVLDKDDDAAYKNWGTNCRMPSKDELEELTNTNNCIWAETTQTNSTGETKGYKFTSKTNGNSIFLPAAGFRVEEKTDSNGEIAFYWSNCASSNDDNHYNRVYALCNRTPADYPRFLGMPVRPVSMPQNSVSMEEGTLEKLTNYVDPSWE